MATVTLSGDYGYTGYSVSSLAADTIIDATAATWVLQNVKSNPDTVGCNTGNGSINRYPFQVDSSSGARAIGGVINGEVPQDTEWQNTYVDINTGGSCNSAAVRFDNSPNCIAEGWRIDRCWDGLRFTTGSDGWTALRCHISNVRDDALENTRQLNGTVTDCLFDGVTSGISMSQSDTLDGSMNEVVMDGLLIRMKAYLINGEVTHNSPVKSKSPSSEMPGLRWINCVVAISVADHQSQNRLQRAWDRTIESTGNYFLNLSDDALPGGYPKSFPLLGGGDWVGFTVLNGQPARDHWDAAKAAWLAGEATYNKFDDFVEQISKAVHDLDGTHTIKVALTDTLPVSTQVSFDDVTNHAAPAAANGYPTGGVAATPTLSETGGWAKLVLSDVVFTATAGGIGPFRYVVVYNDTPTTPVADPLIAWYDYGVSSTLADTEVFTLDFDSTAGFLTVT